MTTPSAPADELVRGLENYAEILGCCVPTVRKLMAEGCLPGRLVGNSYLTTRAKLIEAVAKMGGRDAA
jgi:hypothetical protein